MVDSKRMSPERLNSVEHFEGYSWDFKVTTLKLGHGRPKRFHDRILPDGGLNRRWACPVRSRHRSAEWRTKSAAGAGKCCTERLQGRDDCAILAIPILADAKVYSKPSTTWIKAEENEKNVTIDFYPQVSTATAWRPGISVPCEGSYFTKRESRYTWEVYCRKGRSKETVKSEKECSRYFLTMR